MSIENFKQNIQVVDTSSLVDKVKEQLVELLQNKKLKVGDKIPTELELTRMLGVSRTVIREALLQLRMMGLITSKKKKGAYITSPDIFDILSKSMYPHILDQETLKDLFELRLILEIGMADFIFQNITPDDIRQLREIVGDEPPQTSKHLFNIDHEIAFHGKLYEIAGNNTLKGFQKLLLPVFDYVHHSGILQQEKELKTFLSHSGLVDILENGTPADFTRGMREHLENHFVSIFNMKNNAQKTNEVTGTRPGVKTPKTVKENAG